MPADANLKPVFIRIQFLILKMPENADKSFSKFYLCILKPISGK